MLEPAEGFIHTESCRHTTFTWSDVTMFLMFLMFSGRKIYKICSRNEKSYNTPVSWAFTCISHSQDVLVLPLILLLINNLSVQIDETWWSLCTATSSIHSQSHKKVTFVKVIILRTAVLSAFNDLLGCNYTTARRSLSLYLTGVIKTTRDK